MGLECYIQLKINFARLAYYSVRDVNAVMSHYWRCWEAPLFLLLLFATLCAACRQVLAYDEVVLQLRWDHQFQFAGYYAAKWQGYYAEADLEVEIRPAPQADGRILQSVAEVATGRAEFGIGAADILLGLDGGIPLRLLAAIFQTDATAWYALPESGLHYPGDFLRLRVLRAPGNLSDVALHTLLRAEGLDPAQVTMVESTDADYWKQLVTGQVDVIPGYTLATPLLLRQQGYEFNELHPRSYGVDFYGDSLFTHARLIENNPDLVMRFTEASLRGWHYAMAHPETIAGRITRELPRVVEVADFAALNRFQIPRVRELMLYPLVEIGHINPARWQAMYRALTRAGLVSGSFDVDRFIHDPERLLLRQRAQLQQRLLILSLVLLGLALLVAVWYALRRQADHIRLRALAESETKLRQIIDLIPHMIFVKDAGGRYLLANQAEAEFFGFSVEQMLERSMTEVAHNPAEAAAASREDRAVLAVGERLVNPEKSIHNAQGNLRLLHAIKIPFTPIGGKRPAVLGVAMDVTEERRNRQRLRLLAGAIQQLEDAVCITEADPLDPPGPRIVFVNPAFQRITGYPPQEVIGRSPRFLQGPKSSRRELRRIREHLDQRRPVQGEVVNYTKSGRPFWMGLRIAPVSGIQGRVTHYVAIARDVTEEHRSRRRVEYEATHDALTGLANRSLLHALLGEALARQQRHGGILALLFIDLDRFKPVNDNFGHEAGDALLREVAARLRQTVRQSDTVARLGGDEFAILLDRLEALSQAEMVARKILQLLTRPFRLGEHTVSISASVGIGGCPRDGDTVEALLRHADQAMYRVKQGGRNGFSFSGDGKPDTRE